MGNNHQPSTEASGQMKACDWTVTFERHAGEINPNTPTEK